MLNRSSTIAAIMLMLIGGLVAGLAITSSVLASRYAPGTVRAAEWSLWPRAGAPDVDPYSRALHAVRGDLPLAPGEGLALFATTDSSGRRLDGRCVYEVSGTVPPARAWTLTAYRPDGRPLDIAGARAGVTSSEASVPGRAIAAFGPELQPGNWVRTRPGEVFVVVLRLYDTALSASAQALDPQRLPRMIARGCG